MKVLIIGGGLAGLSLAQGLKQANIPFHIFERDASASYRAQGYRIRISPQGADALKHLLPEHLWNIYEATAARLVHGGHQINALTGEATAWARGGPPTPAGVPQLSNGRSLPDGKAYNVDRAVLRAVLLSGLEDDISFAKQFERYELPADEKVVAHFQDGTSEQGSILVGADGIKSLVRKQLLPHFALLDTEGRAVFGKTEITGELLREMAPQIGQGNSLAGESQESRIKLFCDGMRWDRQASCGPAGQVGFQLPADYIYWVLVFRKDVVCLEEERTLLSLSGEQSAQLAIKLTTGWSEKLRTLLNSQRSDAASTLAFLTAPPDFDLKWSAKPTSSRGRITLIGDSAHPMPPVGGIGANAGFEDSADLCDALVQLEATTEGPLRELVIINYETSMLQRTKAAVERSSVGAGHFFGMRPLSELKVAVT